MTVDQRLHAIHLGQQCFGQHFGGGAAGHHTAVVEHIQAVAEGRRQVEVMEAGQGRQAEGFDQPQQLQLVARVEVVGRLVEDQQRRLLHQGAGQQHALLFPAGEVGESLALVLSQTHPRQGLLDQSNIGLVIAIKQALVRRAAHGGDFGHGEAEVLGKLLQHHRHPLRAPARRTAPQRFAVQLNAALIGPLKAVGAAQQAGLAAAIGADQTDQLAVAHRQFNAVEQGLIAIGRPGQVADLQARHQKR